MVPDVVVPKEIIPNPAEEGPCEGLPVEKPITRLSANSHESIESTSNSEGNDTTIQENMRFSTRGSSISALPSLFTNILYGGKLSSTYNQRYILPIKTQFIMHRNNIYLASCSRNRVWPREIWNRYSKSRSNKFNTLSRVSERSWGDTQGIILSVL